MKSFLLAVNVICAALLISGCQQSASEETTASAQVFGHSISFPGGKIPAGIITTPAGMINGAVISLPGRLRWDEDKTVRVFSPYAGRVTKIIGQLGDRVSANAPLAELNSPDYGTAQAEYQKALAGRSLTQHALSRARDLFAHDVIAFKEVEQAQADAAIADAEAARAENVLRSFADSGAVVTQLLMLRTPIAGVIVEKNINPGQEVRPDQAGAAQFVVTDPSSLWVQLDAREADLPLLKAGGEFKFAVAAYPDETFQGKIIRVADFVDATTRTVKVIGSVDNHHRRLKGEMFITAVIPTSAASQPQTLASAVLLLDDKHYLFVRKGAAYERREVMLGTQQGNQVAILNGIAANDLVVTDGALYLQALLAGARG